MQRQLTARTSGLITEAINALTQAQYEGDHTRRQDPEPEAGTPWDRPDLPVEVLAELQRHVVALNNLVRVYTLAD
jgi:hypothetical protein